MSTKIIAHEKRIKIYFRQGKHFVRYNTGIPVSSLSEFPRNDPNNLFRPISQEYDEFNKRIKKIRALIEKIIDDNQWKLGITINNEFIKQRIEVTHNKSFTKKTLLEYYKDFLTQKINYFEENKFSVLSGKDYNSLLQSLIDYHLSKNVVYNIEDLNYDLVNNFLSFLTSRHSKYVLKNNIDEKLISIIQTLVGEEGGRSYKQRFSGDKIKLLTTGELSDNSVIKRFDNLQEFIKYLYKYKIISWLPNDISDLRKLYKAYSPSFTTLTKDELINLYKFKIDFDQDDHRYQFVRDIFLFMALTGFRFSDVLTFNREKNIRGDKIYKYPQKTEKYDAVSIISIQPVVRLLLERYDYKLNRYGNTLFNRYLSELLQKTGMFNQPFFKKKRVKGRPVQMQTIFRYQAISTHTGRRTCITNLIDDGYELARIRTITGHSSDRMLLKYYDAFRQDNNDNADLARSLDFTIEEDFPVGIKNNCITDVRK